MFFVVLQLPVYIPSDQEKKDTILYGHNVREYMVKPSLILHWLSLHSKNTV